MGFRLLQLKCIIPGPLAGEWLQYETVSGRSLATVIIDWTTDLISSMVTEMIRAVNYFPGNCQKPI